MSGHLAARLSGSHDVFARSGRAPSAGINFVTTHDGFTLEDLVSYERKHNEANHEGNRDGSDHNRSANYGVEGPTDDPKISSLRARQKRNLLATLLFSQGVPMLVAGDELGRTQHGNNNAYCQDNEVSWIDWEGADRELLAFVSRLLRLRNKHPLFRRRTYPKPEDTSWLAPEGREMTEADWKLPYARCFGMLMIGRKLAERDGQGNPILDDDLLLLLNAHHDPVEFALPGEGWVLQLDTAGEQRISSKYGLQGRSLALFTRTAL
jgi:glycogen operon protein